MSEREDYDDGPRASHRPTLSEREPAPAEREPEPAPAPAPQSGTPVSARSLAIGTLAGVGVMIPRLIGEFQTVRDLDQPWRFLAYAAGFVGWYGPLVALSCWLDSRAKRTQPPATP
jgi:hypothetical protein